MKRLLIASIFFVGSMLASSCGGDDDPTPTKSPEEIAIEKLTGQGTQTWAVAGGGAVQHKGANATSDFAEFEITFSSAGSNQVYMSSNSQLLFDENGSWTFAGSNYDKIVLTGTQPAAGREISFSRLGDNLRLEFNVPTPMNGKVTALAGDYIFDLKKK